MSKKSSDRVFMKTFMKFLNTDNNDVFEVAGKRLTRSELRTLIAKTNGDVKLLTSRPKNTPINNLSHKIKNPFEILQFNDQTDVQKLVMKHSNNVQFTGNYAYSCSCGAGKTVAGLYLMYKLQCKTLIISSRNAVNDQWKKSIELLYPELSIVTKDGATSSVKQEPIDISIEAMLKNLNTPSTQTQKTPDVCIVSPQWLTKHMDLMIPINKRNKIQFLPSLIIYDEIHSLLSEEFINVLTLPYQNVVDNTCEYLPYMMGLSATFPTNGVLSNIVNHIFGSVFRSNSEVTNIPVDVWDYRDHYPNLGTKFDSRYHPLDDYETIHYFFGDSNTFPTLPEFTSKYKGLIITYSINSSVYAALYIHKKFNINIMLIRSANEYNVFFPKDVGLDYKFDELVQLEQLPDIFPRVDNLLHVDESEIIVGTVHRLKEGFSVQNITWGICTKFPWTLESRIQILGRIRRNSDDPELNKHHRIMYVMSSTIPSTVGNPRHFGEHKLLYNLELERMMFEVENYKRV